MIGNIKYGCPTLVDDMIMISTTPNDLQKQFDICNIYANIFHYEYNTSKCAVMIIGPNRYQNFNYKRTLGNAILCRVDKQEHLGLTISENMSCHQTVQKVIKKGKMKLFAISSLADTDININPKTAESLYKHIVMPIILYGCEKWTNIQQEDINSLHQLKHLATKVFLKLPLRTRSDMCESILGMK